MSRRIKVKWIRRSRNEWQERGDETGKWWKKWLINSEIIWRTAPRKGEIVWRWADMEVPKQSFNKSSWDSRTCHRDRILKAFLQRWEGFMQILILLFDLQDRSPALTETPRVNQRNYRRNNREEKWKWKGMKAVRTCLMTAGQRK